MCIGIDVYRHVFRNIYTCVWRRICMCLGMCRRHVYRDVPELDKCDDATPRSAMFIVHIEVCDVYSAVYESSV